MAAAYNLPPIADDPPNPQAIAISSTGASPATCIILNGQGVSFVNSSNNPINVSFEADVQGVTVFSQNPLNVASNSSVTIYPQTQNRTVNFNLDGSQVYPYAIQVGGGPLYISVSANNTGVINVTPSPAVIPAGGTWQVYKASGDNNTYNVTWPGIAAPPFPSFTVNNTTQTAAVTTNSQVAYQIQFGNSPRATTGHGGGTIKVGGN